MPDGLGENGFLPDKNEFLPGRKLQRPQLTHSWHGVPRQDLQRSPDQFSQLNNPKEASSGCCLGLKLGHWAASGGSSVFLRRHGNLPLSAP